MLFAVKSNVQIIVVELTTVTLEAVILAPSDTVVVVNFTVVPVRNPAPDMVAVIGPVLAPLAGDIELIVKGTIRNPLAKAVLKEPADPVLTTMFQ